MPPMYKIAWSSNKLQVFQPLRYLQICGCFLNASVTARLWGFTEGTDKACLHGLEGGKRRGMEGKEAHFSCMTALATTTCRACLVTTFYLLLWTFARPFSHIICHLCDFLCNVSLYSLLSFFCPPSFIFYLSHLLSGKEASNHTLRPGGPPPIPKSPSKVNTCSHTHTMQGSPN